MRIVVLLREGPADKNDHAVKLPFPLTIKFKSMLQAGVATKDMDPRWMSSISWYFLCIFGLQPVFNFILGSDNGVSPPQITHALPS